MDTLLKLAKGSNQGIFRVTFGRSLSVLELFTLSVSCLDYIYVYGVVCVVWVSPSDIVLFFNTVYISLLTKSLGLEIQLLSAYEAGRCLIFLLIMLCVCQCAYLYAHITYLKLYL